MLIFGLSVLLSVALWGLLFIYTLFEHFFQTLKELNNWYINLLLSVAFALLVILNIWGGMAGSDGDNILFISSLIATINACVSIFFYLDAREMKTQVSLEKEKNVLQDAQLGEDGEIVFMGDTEPISIIPDDLPSLEELLD